MLRRLISTCVLQFSLNPLFLGFAAGSPDDASKFLFRLPKFDVFLWTSRSDSNSSLAWGSTWGFACSSTIRWSREMTSKSCQEMPDYRIAVCQVSSCFQFRMACERDFFWLVILLAMLFCSTPSVWAAVCQSQRKMIWWKLPGLPLRSSLSLSSSHALFLFLWITMSMITCSVGSLCTDHTDLPCVPGCLGLDPFVDWQIARSVQKCPGAPAQTSCHLEELDLYLRWRWRCASGVLVVSVVSVRWCPFGFVCRQLSGGFSSICCLLYLPPQECHRFLSCPCSFELLTTLTLVAQRRSHTESTAFGDHHKKQRQGRLVVDMRSIYREFSSQQPNLEGKCVNVDVDALAVVRWTNMWRPKNGSKKKKKTVSVIAHELGRKWFISITVFCINAQTISVSRKWWQI